MKPIIKTFPTTKFIGMNNRFSYSDYRIGELWGKFMPRRNEIQNALVADLFNIQINPDNFDFYLPHSLHKYKNLKLKLL